MRYLCAVCTVCGISVYDLAIIKLKLQQPSDNSVIYRNFIALSCSFNVCQTQLKASIESKKCVKREFITQKEPALIAAHQRLH